MNCSASLNSSSCQKRQNKTFQLAATRLHGVTQRRTEGHLSVVPAHRQHSRRLVNTASQHEREKKRRKKRRRYRPLRLLFGGCQLGLEAKMAENLCHKRAADSALSVDWRATVDKNHFGHLSLEHFERSYQNVFVHLPSARCYNNRTITGKKLLSPAQIAFTCS